MSSFNLNTIDFYTDEVFVLSIETTKKIDNENDNLGLMHFSQDNDKFVYVFLNKSREHSYKLSYSKKENVSTINQINHPIFRECLKYFKIKTILALHSNLPWVYFNLMPGNIVRNFFTKKIMEISIKNCETLIVNSYFAKNEISNFSY